jgi:predicted dienelactone hydrolase
MVRFLFFVALCLPFTFASAAEESAAAKYDPLTMNSDFRAVQLELTVHDAKRSRDIPLRVYLPESSLPAPVVLFSHGLGGSRNGNEFLGQHWAPRGYVAVFVQHPGSDISVWKNKPPENRMGAMKEAASLENFELRAADVPAVLDQLEAWNTNDQRLKGRMDLKKIGMSGHSFSEINSVGDVVPIGTKTKARSRCPISR